MATDLVRTAVVVLAVLTACSPTPTLDDVATDDAGFSDCVEATGASLDGSDDWDADEARAFWDVPGTLDCAIDELDREQRRDALEQAFPSIDFDDDDYLASLTAQQQLLADWAASSATDGSLDGAVGRAGALLASTPATDADYDFAAGLVSATALGAMRGADELPSYEAYLAGHPGDDDTAELMVRFSSGTSISDADRARYEQVRADVLAELGQD